MGSESGGKARAEEEALKARALANLDAALRAYLALGQEPPRFAHLCGEALTLAQIREEIEKWTEIGQVHARIWAKSEEEVRAEVAKAKASVRAA